MFGGVINGFQRYDLNNIVGTASSIATAIVNVIVLLAGYGLVELVVATTAVRVLDAVGLPRQRLSGLPRAAHQRRAVPARRGSGK